MTGFKISNQTNHVNRKNLLTHKGIKSLFCSLTHWPWVIVEMIQPLYQAAG